MEHQTQTLLTKGKQMGSRRKCQNFWSVFFLSVSFHSVLVMPSLVSLLTGFTSVYLQSWTKALEHIFTSAAFSHTPHPNTTSFAQNTRPSPHPTCIVEHWNLQFLPVCIWRGRGRGKQLQWFSPYQQYVCKLLRWNTIIHCITSVSHGLFSAIVGSNSTAN